MNNKPSDSNDLPYFYYTHKEFNHKSINIGKRTYGIPHVIIGISGGTVTIGDYCSISNGVRIYILPQHNSESISTYPFSELKSDWPGEMPIRKPSNRAHIKIGSDVWLGQGCQILGGAEIGDGAIIGSCAVVAGKVPPYAIVVGNPANILRYRFSKKAISQLLEIRWWEWPEEKVREYAPLLAGDDIESFIKAISL